MELKDYSNECLQCKCRTCRRTYKLNGNLSACFTWCDEYCKGEDTTARVLNNESCHDYILIES